MADLPDADSGPDHAPGWAPGSGPGSSPGSSPATAGVLLTRAEPLTPAELDWRARVVVWLIAKVTRGEAPHVFTTVARHPRLFRRWLPFAGTLLLRTDLPRREVELIVLRTACNASSPYIWTQHATLASEAGLDGARIAAVPDWQGWAQWSRRERALLEATDELHATRVITDETWSQLEHLLTEHERIELCFVVGQYEMVAMAVNSLGVAPEPWAAARLDAPATAVAEAARRRLARRRTGAAESPTDRRSGTPG